MYVISQVLYFCNPDGYTGTSTITFRFGCTSCPAAETQFFFKIDLQTLGKTVAIAYLSCDRFVYQTQVYEAMSVA